MKKFLKIFIVLFVVLGICFTISACGVGYNAVVVDSGIEYTAEFLKNSITYGAWCDNEDFNVEEDDYDGWYDSESPETRTYIVSELSEADEIFVKCPDVDFEKEMLLVYCWTEIYQRRPVVLKSVKVEENQILKVEFTLKNPSGNVGDASMPMRRIIVIKMDKIDISFAEFSKI